MALLADEMVFSFLGSNIPFLRNLTSKHSFLVSGGRFEVLIKTQKATILMVFAKSLDRVIKIQLSCKATKDRLSRLHRVPKMTFASSSFENFLRFLNVYLTQNVVVVLVMFRAIDYSFWLIRKLHMFSMLLFYEQAWFESCQPRKSSFWLLTD